MNAPLSPAMSDALRRALAEVTLDDKYALPRGRAFMSGTQALVRLPMLQRERDAAAGLDTAGFVSGYRGSPLGGLDQALWKARDHLERNRIVFQPGLNEDLAATSIWGTQQLNLSGKAKYAGVFAMWYGKGPGVDRSGDVLRHANAAGSSRFGGVLALAGDDHGAKSSTLPHQSDHIFKAVGLPVLYPSSVQEYLDLGLHGWAMSRYSGLWVAMKTVTEVVEASASVEVDPERVHIVLPEDFEMPAGGLNIRWPDSPLEQEARLLDYKWYAALAYVRANRLNRVVIDSPRAWFGIMTGGKAYLDTRQALDELGLDEAACARIGIRVFKCGVVWPLEAASASEFADGLGEILVVEEKRQILEYAIKEELYNWPDGRRPRVYGKFDEKDGRGGEWSMPQGGWLLPAHHELSPAVIARAIAARLLDPGRFGERFALDADTRSQIEARLRLIEAKDRALAAPHAIALRTPTFCSGCPHNTSTHVPEGSRALAGIGCHYMANWMPERRTGTFTQMGGEGVPWIGMAPFTEENHIFANLGDGTYFHSGLLAIRASIAAGVNITYKILYNDAVAMTGGQPVDGTLTVPSIVAQLRAEGAREIVIATDEPERYEGRGAIAGVEVFHRDHLEFVQKRLRETPGCTVLVYDQTCASEKRRRRKRVVDGKPGFPDPARRVFINELVCEGCGDCSVQSSCVSVEPVETVFGRKRRINQSSCNKDYSCLKGFCPSFVTIEGGGLRKPRAKDLAGLEFPALPEPARAGFDADRPIFGLLVAGVGGTGVITIGQLLGMAAHLEGCGVSVLDMAGLAQKGGAVTSHVQIARRPEQLHGTRIGTGEADVVIGADLVVAAGNDALTRMRPGLTRVVVNSDVAPTSDFLRNPDWRLPRSGLAANLVNAAGADSISFIDATEIATRLMGDAIYANPLLLGFAWQKGWIPLARQAIERAIELNAVAVDNNLAAFEWGRRLAGLPDRVHEIAGLSTSTAEAGEAGEVPLPPAEALAALVEPRAEFLVGYQDAAYAERFRALVAKVARREREVAGDAAEPRLAAAVARSWFKLLAYKDEYEVARLHVDPAFRQRLEETFEGDWSLRLHLSPSILSRVDPRTGRPRKIAFGAWMLPVMRLLARGKRLRGTRLDPFGYLEERRVERAMIDEYEQLLEVDILPGLDPARLGLAVEIASLPQSIRGFGPVKARAIRETNERHAALLARWRTGLAIEPAPESASDPAGRATAEEKAEMEGG
ncbi:MAG: indolepyruvate ferredoxin oxidoreductase family protein [Pseudomonadota bacterium]|nr:indolepyruvate ferredoxin oxidoreductase family protein [Pseudomonadota bacterium]